MEKDKPFLSAAVFRPGPVGLMPNTTATTCSAPAGLLTRIDRANDHWISPGLMAPSSLDFARRMTLQTALSSTKTLKARQFEEQKKQKHVPSPARVNDAEG